jgi:hypothetical protein
VAFAQNVEYGSPAELKGVTRIYVDTGAELKARNDIVSHIQKELPSVVVTDSAEDAEVVLVFGSSASTRYIGSHSTTTINSGGDQATTSSMPQYKRVVRGDGLVVKPGKGGRPRLLIEFGDARGNVFERKPSTNFAREFIKAYKKANDEEKK